MVFLIDGSRGLARRIGKIERTEVAGLKLLGDAALLLVLFEDAGNERQILIEAVGQAADAGLLHVAVQNFFLERDVHAFVGIFSDDGLVIEGEKERVYEEHPTEPFRVQVTRHGHTIRHGGLDAALVEDVVPITGASRFLSRAGPFLQPAHVLLGQV